MLKKVQIFKALDIEIKKQKGPAAVKDAYKGHHSLKEELSQPGISIIAETAGGNPLRGQVRESYRASTHAKSLVENGARVISVATDRFLFYGEDKHLSDVRSAVKVPLLRHDFIFEE
jgi:indole-3-glycerol phosphate synthase